MSEVGSPHAWSEVLPPEKLERFLRDLNLVQYVDTFVELGYDDVDDLASFDVLRLQKLEQRLLSSKVKPGHVDKIIDKLTGLPSLVPATPKAAAAVSTSSATPPNYTYPTVHRENVQELPAAMCHLQLLEAELNFGPVAVICFTVLFTLLRLALPFASNLFFRVVHWKQ